MVICNSLYFVHPIFTYLYYVLLKYKIEMRLYKDYFMTNINTKVRSVSPSFKAFRLLLKLPRLIFARLKEKKEQKLTTNIKIKLTAVDSISHSELSHKLNTTIYLKLIHIIVLIFLLYVI